MSAGKVVLIVLGVIALLCVGTCAVCTAMVGAGANAIKEAEDKRVAKQEVADKQLTKDLEKCKDEEAVPWEKILTALKANEAKVAAAWKNSCAKVTGVVARVDSGIDDKPFVVIGSGEEFSLQDLHCKPKDEKRALDLTKGQKITVWGMGGGEIMGSLILEHCDW